MKHNMSTPTYEVAHFKCVKTYIESSALMCRVNSYKTEKFDYYNALSLAD